MRRRLICGIIGGTTLYSGYRYGRKPYLKKFGLEKYPSLLVRKDDLEDVYGKNFFWNKDIPDQIRSKDWFKLMGYCPTYEDFSPTKYKHINLSKMFNTIFYKRDNLCEEVDPEFLKSLIYERGLSKMEFGLGHNYTEDEIDLLSKDLFIKMLKGQHQQSINSSYTLELPNSSDYLEILEGNPLIWKNIPTEQKKVLLNDIFDKDKFRSLSINAIMLQLSDEELTPNIIEKIAGTAAINTNTIQSIKGRFKGTKTEFNNLVISKNSTLFKNLDLLKEEVANLDQDILISIIQENQDLYNFSLILNSINSDRKDDVFYADLVQKQPDKLNYLIEHESRFNFKRIMGKFDGMIYKHVNFKVFDSFTINDYISILVNPNGKADKFGKQILEKIPLKYKTEEFYTKLLTGQNDYYNLVKDDDLLMDQEVLMRILIKTKNLNILENLSPETLSQHRNKLNDKIFPISNGLYLGKELKDGTEYIKILNEFENDGKFQFKVGENEDTRSLNPVNRTNSSGLSFTSGDDLEYFKKYVNLDGVMCRGVDFDDEELVFKMCDFDNGDRRWRCRYKASKIRLSKDSITL